MMTHLSPGKQLQAKPGQKGPRKGLTVLVMYLYMAYLVIILITKVAPIIANTYIDSIQNDMADEYTYHLRFPTDGYQSHYYVERWNSSAMGVIDLSYHTQSHTLEVKCANIMVLGIDTRSMYEDECEKIIDQSPYDDTNLYKKYFIERNLFTVNIITLDARPILNLSFSDIPIAQEIRVNNDKWIEGTDYSYTSDYELVLSKVPSGTTNVEIWFSSPDNTGPTALVETIDVTAEVGEQITFDASQSHDDKGIVDYCWDFGDGNHWQSATPATGYTYYRMGNYSAILTVIDSDGLLDRAYISVRIMPDTGNHAPIILWKVPGQEQYEDCPPWTLNLGGYGADVEDTSSELRWFVTGENTSLYTVAGENASSVLTFIPVPNAFGNDEVTLWLMDRQGAMISQQMWINITPRNDKPFFDPDPPNLIIHYYDTVVSGDDPYTWDYSIYAHDVETDTDHLGLSTSEPTTDSGDGYIQVNGLEATFYYPHSRLGSSIPVTLSLSDGQDIANTVITVKISSNWAPRLISSLPDVTIEENSTSSKVFDLDDYFWDRDNDTLFYASGHSHVDIVINDDHTVDFISSSNWFGTESVTFRAYDPTGAIIEDVITVIVTSTNDPPEIARVPDIMLHYDFTYSFDLSPYIEDKDNSTKDLIVWTSEPASNIWVSHKDNMLLLFNYPESRTNELINVTIWVSDGMDHSYQEIMVTVADNYPPELMWELPDVVFREDEYKNGSLNLDFYFTDIDSDVLYYSYGYTYLAIGINDNHTVDFSAPLNWYGSEKVTFRATDSGMALAEDTIVVTVIPENDAPQIGKIPDQWASSGDIWVVDISDYLSDIDNELGELELSVLSTVDESCVSVSGFFLIFEYQNGVRGDIVTVIVSDGDKVSYRTFSVNLETHDMEPSDWKTDMGIWALITTLIVILAEMTGYGLIRGRFRVHEVFLIHKTGLLIGHCAPGQKEYNDDSDQTGMLIAGMNLIRDSFSNENTTYARNGLKVLGKSLLAERGDLVYMLVVYTGRLKNGNINRIRNTVVRVEDIYGGALRTWQGDSDELVGIDDVMRELL